MTKKTPNKAASALGKRSAAARKRKYGSKKFKEMMRKLGKKGGIAKGLHSGT
jgi:hypothetical protein